MAQNSNKMETQIDQVVQKAIEENRIVGTVIIVAKDGKVVYEKASGYADLETKKPMQKDEIFLLASVTKPIVTAVVMKFIEDGKLKLTDPVTKFLPDFKPKLPNGTSPEITIHELLTHTSGLSYQFLEPKNGDYYTLNVSDGLSEPGLSLDENLKRLSQTQLKFEPGSKWNYSLSIDVLGAVLEKISRKSLSELVSEYVTSPLKMKNTGFSITGKSKLSSFYANKKNGVEKMYDGIFVPLDQAGVTFAPSRILDRKSYNSGGGGMAGTAEDLLKFFETIRKNDGTLLKKETIDFMKKDHVGEQAETQGPGWGFGYGWAVLDDPKKTNSVLSNGTIQWGGAYGHRWFIDPVKNITVIALTNTTFEGMNGAFPEELTKAIYKNLR